MTTKSAIRCTALALAVSGAGLASVFAQSSPGVDISSLPQGDQDAIRSALNRGDYEQVAKLARTASASQAGQRKSSGATRPNTDWERLKACGFYPQETRLECIVEIERTGNEELGYGTRGYNGTVTALGSREDVFFCVNLIPVGYGGHLFPIWSPVGKGYVVVHDQPNVSPWTNEVPPWEYAVYRDFMPFGSARTSTGGNKTITESEALTFEVKAILVFGFPWYDPAVNCSFQPTYGDILVFQVRADPIR